MIVLLSRRITDPLPADRTMVFDMGGAILSAATRVSNLGLIVLAAMGLIGLAAAALLPHHLAT